MDCVILVDIVVVYIHSTTFVSARGGGPFNEIMMFPRNVWSWVPFSSTTSRRLF